MDKEEGQKRAENLKLEIVKKMLTCELLERRIVGIKELNTIIRGAQHNYGGKQGFSLENVIKWILEHGVFDIIWDVKKTHL